MKQNLCQAEPSAPSKYSESIVSLTKYRTIVLSENVTTETSNAISSLLIYYNSISSDEIKILINTNGGSVASLMNIYDVIKLIDCPVRTIVIGKAYSAGAFILASGTNGLRGALPHASIMIHGIQTMLPREETSKVKSYLDFLERRNNGLLKVFAKNVGKTFDEVKKDCENDCFMSAEEALKYGIIDYIVDGPM